MVILSTANTGREVHPRTRVGALTGCARHTTGGGKSRTICSPRVAQVSASLRCVMDATLPESVAQTQQSGWRVKKKGLT
jgi:hypothetical protein